MTTNDRDAMIRLAIAPPIDVVAPADLGDAIYSEVLATPQRRGIVRLVRLGWVPAPSPLLLTIGLLALLAVGLVVAGLLRPPEPPLLSMYHGGPDRTGVMPGPGPTGDVAIAWTIPRTGAITFTSMPLPAGERVFVADLGGTLAALDPGTGTPIWEEDVGGAIYGAPALVDGLVVVGTEAGDVVAFTEAGAEAWRQPLDAGAVLASPLVADGVIYAGTEHDRLFALAPTDGHVLWSIETGGAVTRGPAFADGTVYVGTAEGGFLAVDVATRTVRWPVELGAGEVGTPAVAGGRVYVARGIEGTEPTHDLVALDTRDGREVWSFPSPGGEQVHLGAIAHGRVYATSEDGSLYALDPETGSLLGTFRIGGRLTTLATVVGDVIYVGSSPDFVFAIDATTGSEIWHVGVEGDPTMAAVLGGRAYIGTSLGQVVAIAGSETE